MCTKDVKAFALRQEIHLINLIAAYSCSVVCVGLLHSGIVRYDSVRGIKKRDHCLRRLEVVDFVCRFGLLLRSKWGVSLLPMVMTNDDNNSFANVHCEGSTTPLLTPEV